MANSLGGDRESPTAREAADKRATGRAGEELAVGYLERRGCKVLARNWLAHPGEIDVVVECPAAPGETAPVLAFVEIRTRHGVGGLAEESISRRKAGRMASAAYAYMAAHDLDPDTTPWRLDLIAIAMSGLRVDSIRWAKGAIEAGMLDSED